MTLEIFRFLLTGMHGRGYPLPGTLIKGKISMNVTDPLIGYTIIPKK